MALCAGLSPRVDKNELLRREVRVGSALAPFAATFSE